jgi:esterase/lipase superfamily enzyme
MAKALPKSAVVRVRDFVTAIAVAFVVAGAPALAQTPSLSIAQVIQASETHDVAVLKRAVNETAWVEALKKDDPQSAIELKLGVGEALAQAGDKRGALLAYTSALADMAKINGEHDPQQIDVLRKTAVLRSQVADLAGAALDLDRALDIAKSVLNETDPIIVDISADNDKAWASYQASNPSVHRPLQFSSRAIATDQFDLVQIYYATHRKATGSSAPAKFYGGERGPLVYGKAVISVPRNRAAGKLPLPSVWKLEFRADPEKHVILTSVTPMSSRDTFFSDVRDRVAGSKRKEAFVFIHGFNSSFEAAAQRTAQLAADLNIDGAPILYSWPSRASALGYRADEAEADIPAQIDDLADFLTTVARDTGAVRVNVVAHSLGNKFLTKALVKLSERPVDQRPSFDEVVLAAPDVAADDFGATWLSIRPLAKRYTLYASRRDFALMMSDGYNRKQRLGDARTSVSLEGMQTVDTTLAKGGLLGHADFTGNALDDFRALIWDSLAPSKRCVLQSDSEAGKDHWVFAAGTGQACADSEFREVVSLVREAGSPTQALQELQGLTNKPDVAQQLSLAGLTFDGIRRRLLLTYGLSAGAP